MLKVKRGEDERVGLVEAQAALQELEMVVGDEGEFPAGAVGGEGGQAAHAEPGRRVEARAGLQEHLVVVAQQRDQAAAATQVDQPVDDAPAVRPSVDVVAQGDDDVLGAGPMASAGRPGPPSSRGCRRWRWCEWSSWTLTSPPMVPDSPIRRSAARWRS